MTTVHTVKIADRHIRTTGRRGEILDVLDRDHRHSSPSGRSVLIERTSFLLIDLGETSIIIAAVRRIGQSWRLPGNAANSTCATGSRGLRGMCKIEMPS